MSGERPLGLFEGFGVELELMIVDRETLAVMPIADRVLAAAAGGEPEAEVELGTLAWSNELAMHVIELKTNGPAPSLAGLASEFQEHLGNVQAILEPFGARLLPGAMHPWMDPNRETKLWPHEYGPVYRAFDRIFGCKGHGWGNLQSTHLNLPFSGDDEFGRLHAAIRVILPILPALAASSPVADGRVSRFLDHRMEVYRHNADRVPSVMGRVVPERVFTRSGYDGLLKSIYRDLAPLDPEGVLHHEWVNARGCIARFDRGSIEVRVIDSQECPAADLAICAAVTAVARGLAGGKLGSLDGARALSEHDLAGILGATIEETERATISDTEYLRVLGYPEPGPATAGDVWRHLVAFAAANEPGWDEFSEATGVILREGCLARRIRRALGVEPGGAPGVAAPGAGSMAAGFGSAGAASAVARLPEIPREDLARVYRDLADCVEMGRMFVPDA